MKSAGIEVKSKELLTHPCEFSPLIGKYIANLYQSDSTVWEKYLTLVEMYLTAVSSIIPLNCLVEVVGTSPESFAVRYGEKMQWVMVSHTATSL